MAQVARERGPVPFEDGVADELENPAGDEERSRQDDRSRRPDRRSQNPAGRIASGGEEKENSGGNRVERELDRRDDQDDGLGRRHEAPETDRGESENRREDDERNPDGVADPISGGPMRRGVIVEKPPGPGGHARDSTPGPGANPGTVTILGRGSPATGRVRDPSSEIVAKSDGFT